MLTNCTETDNIGPDLEQVAIDKAAATEVDITPTKALPRPHSWGDCEVYYSVVTPTALPPNGPFDELYAGGNGFKDDVPLISESVPGDEDFNGGRWHVNVLKGDVDPDKYMDACKVEDLDLNDFESTMDYFVCPLLPRRGKGDN